MSQKSFDSWFLVVYWKPLATVAYLSGAALFRKYVAFGGGDSQQGLDVFVGLETMD